MSELDLNIHKDVRYFMQVINGDTGNRSDVMTCTPLEFVETALKVSVEENEKMHLLIIANADSGEINFIRFPLVRVETFIDFVKEKLS